MTIRLKNPLNIIRCSGIPLGGGEQANGDDDVEQVTNGLQSQTLADDEDGENEADEAEGAADGSGKKKRKRKKKKGGLCINDLSSFLFLIYCSCDRC